MYLVGGGLYGITFLDMCFIGIFLTCDDSVSEVASGYGSDIVGVYQLGSAFILR